MPTDHDNSYWQKKLTPAQYAVCRLKATEAPFSGDLLDMKQPGSYSCIACGQELFSSQHKYDSGSGWPSFYDAAKPGAIKVQRDMSHGMVRTEVLCARCGSHLGHLFDDGPAPGGQRFCINSVALAFVPKKNLSNN